MRRFGTIGCFVTFTAVTLFLAIQNSNFFVSITANEPLGMAFKGNDLDRFWLACCIGVITATLLALDLTIDFILGWKPIVDDRIERISMMSLQFVRTISLLHCLQKPILPHSLHSDIRHSRFRNVLHRFKSLQSPFPP